ncbi:hypothetical protein A2Y99_03195 [Candidatus Gottesmanbacteria bacterium RBG_13_37_7]|uniref:DNA replication and repair protein RecF n=1 Tax=Candidatus Gottesmanbacteria bacterium RBG_13_37_7 TaxID=1798369 RepID=A0A1F5YGF0_9BACT|nr:MAG: hypothetical protein A2Y99_03195 [Candidatus Gottesmanbacteria bacterium RBG_13_37_7]
MNITHLELTNFRSYSKATYDFSPKTTILLGSNGSGKTNLLEALFFLATGRSFRAQRDSDTIAFEAEIGRIKGNVAMFQFNNDTSEKNNKDNIILEVVLTQGQVAKIKTPIKRYLVNGVGRRGLDFSGKLKVVLFWPEDMELVIGSPSLRRRYLDFVLMQIDREYRRCLLSYERGIRQRNRVLEAIRDKGAHRHQLLFWDQLLIKSGEYITKKREEYINYINNSQLPITNYQLQYDKSIISRLRLEQYSGQEIAAGVTLVGPHRDDMKFKIQNPKFKKKSDNYQDLASFGSRGEQRLAVLWLKLRELSYIEASSGEKPVLLLDDILSEFDHEHRKIVFDVISQQQTIITVADEHFIEKIRLKDVKIIEI